MASTKKSLRANSSSSLSSSSAPPVLPRDARLISLLLAANGAEDAEEGVVRMLVEFAHRYTSDILTDSLMYAEHARSANNGQAATGGANPSAAAGGALVPSIDDVRLAVQARTESASVPKEFLLQLATQVNSVPLPAVPEVYGIRLPPVAQRLTAPNFSIVPRTEPLPATAPANLASGSGSAAGATTTTTTRPDDSFNFDPALVGTTEGSEAGGGGLFGDDDDDDDDDDDADDDEEMEDVTAGFGGSGSMSGSVAPTINGNNGMKRKAGDSDEEYD
ncbi:uncharacterized protein JCM15063_006378 [Sporobolomyces koalae]|uniref:uncharacterized protein n=1 Tax=Sporobolomyces koalae TaxID=500713 RepID=UPI00317FF9BA